MGLRGFVCGGQCHHLARWWSKPGLWASRGFAGAGTPGSVRSSGPSFDNTLSAPPSRVRGFSQQAAVPAGAAPRKVVFSGIQPTGVPHLGNYIGAMRNWVNLQEEDTDTFRMFSVMDLHSITVPQDPETLRQRVLETASSLLAVGLDPAKCTLVQQSRVPQHTELAWILGCFTTTSQLEAMTQWKTKKRAQAQSARLGLFSYPVLMAADVLVYKTTHVPVGDDQRQHLELARTVATAFNKQVGTSVFPAPQTVLPPAAARIMSLRNPENKMSKSDRAQGSRIDITDSVDTVRTKLRKAVTDSLGEIHYDPKGRPGVSNLIEIYCAATGHSPVETEIAFKGCNTLEFKEGVATAVSEHLAPIQAEYARLETDPGFVMQVLDRGAQTAAAMAEQTMVEVRRAVGFTMG
eukprot:m.117772 g.117772  ORF g.117772 m.117772 type:complete len:406 (-) comp13210_c0_seq1:184-1401(-)